jgi:exodeoxyribonuclease VII small subunit
MKAKTFDTAYTELQKIVEQLQSEDVSIDKLSTQIKKATDLVKFCKSKLRNVEDEIASVSEDE